MIDRIVVVIIFIIFIVEEDEKRINQEWTGPKVRKSEDETDRSLRLYFIKKKERVCVWTIYYYYYYYIVY